MHALYLRATTSSGVHKFLTLKNLRTTPTGTTFSIVLYIRYTVLDRLEKIILEKIGYTIFYQSSATPRRIFSMVRLAITHHSLCVSVCLICIYEGSRDTTHCN